MRFWAALGLAAAGNAWAANPGEPDASDLWWNSAQSGWGVNVIQQSNVLFMTFFVYGPDARPRWYVAPDTRCSGAPRDVEQVCHGPLYEAAGPVVSGSFDPAAVERRLVGDTTFLYRRPNAATIDFRVDGVATSRSLRRQTWAVNDLSGEYYIQRVAGADNRPATGCAAISTTMRDLGRVIVTHSGSSIRLATEPGPWPRCEYSGTYAQEGRMGQITGSYTCTGTDSGTSSTGAESGTFTLDEVEVGPRGFMARYSATVGNCRIFGNFAGARATVQ
ncbi:MAG TPA: hypothetical protein VEC19_03630 [Usitatibacter sp.]|nr:hypothetical protein [Usitatibacter sp.]